METPKTCYVYVLDTLADWEIGYVTAELHSGRYIDQGRGIVSLVKIGNSLKPVTTIGGMSITPDLDIESVDFKEGDILLLPGADTWFEEKQQKIIDMVAALLDRKVVVAAICGATAALASKGLLNERKHTSNDKVYLKMVGPQYSGEDYYSNLPAVVDGNLITATGLAPLEFSYELFKLTGVMKERTLEAWYHLHKTRESQYFYDLTQSME